MLTYSGRVFWLQLRMISGSEISNLSCSNWKTFPFIRMWHISGTGWVDVWCSTFELWGPAEIQALSSSCLVGYCWALKRKLAFILLHYFCCQDFTPLYLTRWRKNSFLYLKIRAWVFCKTYPGPKDLFWVTAACYGHVHLNLKIQFCKGNWDRSESFHQVIYDVRWTVHAVVKLTGDIFRVCGNGHGRGYGSRTCTCDDACGWGSKFGGRKGCGGWYCGCRGNICHRRRLCHRTGAAGFN